MVENSASNGSGDTDAVEYEYEPRRIEKGSSWARRFYGVFTGHK